MDILVFVLGLLCSACVVSLSLVKKQAAVALVIVLLSVFSVFQYLLLGQLTATWLSVVGLSYGVLVLWCVRSAKVKAVVENLYFRLSIIGLYTSLFLIVEGGFHFNVSLLAYVGSVAVLLSMMVKKFWTLKIILLVSCLSWTVFQFYTGAYGALVGQAFSLIGFAWSMVVVPLMVNVKNWRNSKTDSSYDFVRV